MFRAASRPALLALLLAPWLVGALASNAPAQIYVVTFKDPRTAKRFPTSCIPWNGAPALVGEAKSGITLDNGRINYQGDKGSNELWAVNTAEPSLVPYKLDGTTYVSAGVKGGTVMLLGNQIEKIEILLRQQSLYGLAREHEVRRRLLADIQKTRDASKPASPDWLLAHARYLAELERLRTWLATTLFPEAAKKVEAELEKQRKSVAKEAGAQRLAGALASIAVVPTPPKLVELAKTVSSGTEFHVQESRHLRFTYDVRLPDAQVKELLELAEKMIDGFRVGFVDPYVGEDFVDLIPEERFVEFWFGPDALEAHEHFLVDWYGVSWGADKAKRVAEMSGRYRRNTQPSYLDYWKIADNKDFDAIVAHQLGHVLANLHFNADRRGDLPAWIEEGVAYWLALSYLGKNGVTCKQFEQEEYAKAKRGADAENTILMGETEIYTRLALEQGSPVDALIRKPLHQMTDSDLAKAWSLFEWVGADEGKRGQLWLRALCEIFTTSGPSLQQYRAKSEELFQVQQGDVFKSLDERWKKHAEELQRTGPELKKK